MTASNRHCQSCGAGDLEIFYRVENIPIHSCLMVKSREEALAFPKRDLHLAFCGSCGFIQNILFDPSVIAYSAAYEESQSFSGEFRKFALGVCRDLIEKYDLRHKRILEIGCGKGDFLRLLCELGDNTGIGIDPACSAERAGAERAARIRFICNSYSEKYRSLDADYICCRHTLEHIPDVGRFIAGLARNLDGKDGTAVFFEVPDVERILDEGAFWDIYYEHCSYFSRGSLSRLFERSGFDVVDCYKGFNDQYLLLECRSASSERNSQQHTADISPLRSKVR